MDDAEVEKIPRKFAEFRLEDQSSVSQERLDGIRRCLESLMHASFCRDAVCRRISCHKIKRVVAHTKVCKKRLNATCPVCKQLIALCCYHAKECEAEECPVLFCRNIRGKLAAQNYTAAAASNGKE